MRVFFACILHCIVLNVFGQEPEMAVAFRSEGKIYVVVAVSCLILVGIFWYLFRLERKVTQLEKQKNEQD